MVKTLQRQRILVRRSLMTSSNYISNEKNILFMIQAADTGLKNESKPAPFHAHFLHRYARDFHDEFHVRHLELEKEIFPPLALFPDTNSNETKIISYLIVSLFISTVLPMAYDAWEELKKWETRAEIREKHFLLKAELHFIPAENASCSQGVLAQNALKNTMQTDPCNKRQRSSAQYV